MITISKKELKILKRNSDLLLILKDRFDKNKGIDEEEGEYGDSLTDIITDFFNEYGKEIKRT